MSITQEVRVSTPDGVSIELDDLQSGILHPRPSPYVGAYIVMRVDDRRDGREMLRRLRHSIASAANWSAMNHAWLTVAITFQGLKALGVPQASLDSFPPEFQEGMPARAEMLGDTGILTPAGAGFRAQAMWRRPRRVH